jgi:AcrR family transcriptional regulator
MILGMENTIPAGEVPDVAARVAQQTLARREAAYAEEVRRLLDAGLDVMRRCGTTSRPRVADIVAAAGLSNDAFYRHFPSKDALVAALVDDGALRLRSYLDHQMAKDPTPEARVRRWVEGDRVMAVVGGGGHAELAVVHERHLLPVPDGIPWDQAGGFPEVFTTAHDAMFTQCGLGMGERLCVHGAAGGVGVAGVQLGVAAGASVVATVRNPDLRPALTDLGAEAVGLAGQRRRVREGHPRSRSTGDAQAHGVRTGRVQAAREAQRRDGVSHGESRPRSLLIGAHVHDAILNARVALLVRRG